MCFFSFFLQGVRPVVTRDKSIHLFSGCPGDHLPTGPFRFSASILVTCSSHSLLLLSIHSLIGQIQQDSLISLLLNLFLFCQLLSFVRSTHFLPTFGWDFLFSLLFLGHMSLSGISFLIYFDFFLSNIFVSPDKAI